jgi:hypothetical protein
MDLVVNSTLKAVMRRIRLSHLYNYFQDWRFAYLQHQHLPSDDRPKFTPMDIKLKDGVQWFFAACSEAFAPPSFKSGMVRAFYKVGLLRRPHSQYYDAYPTKHPNSYGSWVADLRSVALLPSYENECSAFYLGDLFEELTVTNSEVIDDPDSEVVVNVEDFASMSDSDSDDEKADIQLVSPPPATAAQTPPHHHAVINATFNHCSNCTINVQAPDVAPAAAAVPAAVSDVPQSRPTRAAGPPKRMNL